MDETILINKLVDLLKKYRNDNLCNQYNDDINILLGSGYLDNFIENKIICDYNNMDEEVFIDKLAKLLKIYRDNYDSDDEEEEELNILFGSGLLDYFIKNDKLSSSSQKILNNYGDYPIEKIAIYRTPIETVFNKFLNLISFGKFDEYKKKQNYDDFFHLAMIITIKMPNNTLKNIVLEKNATVNISTQYKTNDKTQVKDVDLNNKNLTIKQLINNTLSKINNKRFFLYDAFNSDENSGNCQRFLLDILNSNDLNTPELENFINQSAEDIARNLGSVGKNIIPKVVRGITDLGAVFGGNNFKLHAVIIKKNDDMTPDKIEIIKKEFLPNKKNVFIRETKNSYRLRNIPKTNFKKRSFRTKKINNNISLIYGEILDNLAKNI